jgi:hypothetical protein
LFDERQVDDLENIMLVVHHRFFGARHLVPCSPAKEAVAEDACRLAVLEVAEKRSSGCLGMRRNMHPVDALLISGPPANLPRLGPLGRMIPSYRRHHLAEGPVARMKRRRSRSCGRSVRSLGLCGLGRCRRRQWEVILRARAVPVVLVFGRLGAAQDVEGLGFQSLRRGNRVTRAVVVDRRH